MNYVLFIAMVFLMVWGGVDIVERIVKLVKRGYRQRPKAIITRVVPKPICRWYQTYTFSANGQHFSIDASDLDEAWRQARRLGVSGLLLVDVSGQKCEVKYRA